MAKKTTKKTQTQIVKQNESHDWLGEATENYVRYLFAGVGFQVFAGSKWGADLVIHRPGDPKSWRRIEVRSTDKNRQPIPKPKKRLLQIADFVVNVRLSQKETSSERPCLEAVIYPVARAKKNGACAAPDVIYLDGEKRGVFFGERKMTLLDYVTSDIS